MNVKRTRGVTLTLIILLVGYLHVQAAVTLPKVFSDNMVLQRDKPLKIWGWADPQEAVTISFNGQQVKAKADKSGAWHTELKAMKYGGPYDMTVSGKSGKQTLKNILIGDVWLCSGQSNMEWMLKNTNDAENEIAEANYPKIRLFTVEKATAYQLQDTLAGGTWQVCSPETVPDFSAVAYFFGRKLEQDLDIPIGLLHSSWGGTNVQTWISWDVISKKENYQNIDMKKMQQKAAAGQVNRDQYQQSLQHDKGMTEKWYAPQTKTQDWQDVTLPNEWGSTPIGNTDGIVWFRKTINITASQAEQSATLSLGPIDDEDVTFVNGQQVGSTQAYNILREYTLPAGLLKAGENTIVVKVTDNQGGGGIIGTPEQLFVKTGEKKIPLQGTWKFKPSVLASDFGIQDIGPNSSPSLLYNAMIAPFIDFAIKGVIWYQGESNAGQAYEYRTLFKDLISNWRNKWHDDFPFLWVQLANFQQPLEQPAESDWAELREAQSMALDMPKTGQAVIIDLGEADDIHPRNKQDVGYRLALSALKVAYDKDVVYSGPAYDTMKVAGNKVTLTFTNTGSGLMTKDKYSYVRGFAVAGKDHQFHWAQARLEGNKVVVSSDEVPNPVAVRYAWANNPDDASLYNKEGLPASPFRTDDWKGITAGK